MSDEEVESKPRAANTPLTVDNFMAWKKAFDAEMFELKKKELLANAEMNARLSGKKFFQNIKNLKEVEVELEEDEEEDDDFEEEEKEKHDTVGALKN